MPRHSIAILGGGPGGYEAALVAAQLGADVTVVDSDGLGGACVLTDCVPSKTLIETSNAMTLLNRSAGLGIATGGLATVNAARLYERITDLARAQSADITARLAAEGIKVIKAKGRLIGPGVVKAGDTGDQGQRRPDRHRRAAPGAARRAARRRAHLDLAPALRPHRTPA